MRTLARQNTFKTAFIMAFLLMLCGTHATASKTKAVTDFLGTLADILGIYDFFDEASDESKEEEFKKTYRELVAERQELEIEVGNQGDE